VEQYRLLVEQDRRNEINSREGRDGS